MVLGLHIVWMPALMVRKSSKDFPLTLKLGLHEGVQNAQPGLHLDLEK